MKKEIICLGIDGGGTKTEFCLFTNLGNILCHFYLGPSNPNDITIEKSLELIKQGIDKALKISQIDYIFGGIAGLLTGDNKAIFNDYFSKQYVNIKIEFDTDIINLFNSCDDVDGALIMGTGSVLFIKSNNEITRFGGWGYMLDNFGSGYDLGREAIRTLLDENQFNSDKSQISNLIIKDGFKPEELISRTYKEGKSFVASFSHYIFEAYKLGDNKATLIINNQVEQLGTMINKAFSGFKNTKPLIIVAGGVIEHNKDILISKLVEYFDANYTFSPLPQIFGACRKCLSLSNQTYINFDSSFINNYKEYISHE